MIVDQLPWVEHANEKGESTIYAIDIHPDGTRFATSGGDSRVKIWAVDAIAAAGGASSSARGSDGNVEATDIPYGAHEEEDALLAVLAWHQAQVQCVRWSHSGALLASGADDNVIFLYALKPGPATTAIFGSGLKPNREDWDLRVTLRGHTLDVMHCAWSQDDRYVASCSLDNTVMVWEVPQGIAAAAAAGQFAAAATLAPLRVLRGHESWVRGVAWDPLGRYLASFGDDRRLIIWRTEGDGWAEAARVEKPFAMDSDDVTVMRRVDWSPDGTSLCATNAVQLSQPYARVIVRDSWETGSVSLVGHKTLPCIVRYSPAMYKATGGGLLAVKQPRKANGKGKARASRSLDLRSLVAIASEENLVTVWTTGLPRPLLILSICEDQPTDISWGSDGFTFGISCRGDSVTWVRLDSSELGLAIAPEEEKNDFFRGRYGLDGAPGMAFGEELLAETPLQLAMEQERAAAAAAAPSRSALPPSSSLNGTTSVRAPTRPPPAPPRQPFTAAAAAAESGSGAVVRQLETRRTDGKKRIQPVSVGTGGGAASTAPLLEAQDGGGAMHEPLLRQQQQMQPPASPLTGLVRSGGAASGGGGNGAAAASPLKRRRIDTGPVSQRRPFHPSIQMQVAPDPPNMTPPTFVVPRRGGGGGSSDGAIARRLSVAAPAQEDGSAAPALVLECHVSSGNVLRPPSAGAAAAGGLVAAAAERGGAPVSVGGTHYTQVVLSASGKVVWSSYITGTATACCGNSRMAAVGTSDGSIYCFDRLGARMAPALVVAPPVVDLECSADPTTLVIGNAGARAAAMSSGAAAGGDYLVAVAGNGDVTSWDLRAMRLVVSGSLEPLFRSVGGALRSTPSSSSAAESSDRHPAPPASATQQPRVVRCGVNSSDGSPIVLLQCSAAASGGGGALQAFTLHPGLQTWLRIADGRSVLSTYHGGAGTGHSLPEVSTVSEQFGASVGAAAAVSDALSRWQANVRRGASVGVGALATAPLQLRDGVTRAHVEESMACALLLGSAQEFAQWLGLYARHLAAADAGASAHVSTVNMRRLRSVCESLLRPTGAGASANAAAAAAAAAAGTAGNIASDSSAEMAVAARWGAGASVLGLDKRKLLRQVVLPAMSANRAVQRLVQEYSDALTKISSDTLHGDRTNEGSHKLSRLAAPAIEGAAPAAANGARAMNGGHA